MSVLKVIGRKQAEPELVKEMLDMNSKTKVLYAHEDPEGLILYDCGFAGVNFTMGDDNSRRSLELWGAKLIQKRIIELKIYESIISKYEGEILGGRPSFSKAEYPKSFKRIKETAHKKEDKPKKEHQNGDKDSSE